MKQSAIVLVVTLLSFVVAEYQSIDGTGNNPYNYNLGAAGMFSSLTSNSSLPVNAISNCIPSLPSHLSRAGSRIENGGDPEVGTTTLDD